MNGIGFDQIGQDVTRNPRRLGTWHQRTIAQDRRAATPIDDLIRRGL